MRAGAERVERRTGRSGASAPTDVSTGRPARRVICLVGRNTPRTNIAGLRSWFGPGSGVAVIIDRRGTRSTRRVGEDQQERRAAQVGINPPALPPSVRPLARGAVFCERLPRSAANADDAEALRLISRYQSGDSTAFSALYTSHLPLIYRYLLTQLGDHHTAEDLAQEILLKALETLDEFELTLAPFRVWLFKVARNHLLNHRIRAARLRVEDPSWIHEQRGGHVPAVDHEALRRIQNAEFLQMLRHLPAAQRQVLTLRYVGGLSCPEIAVILGRTPAAVRTLQNRAFSFLRLRLEAVRERESASCAA